MCGLVNMRRKYNGVKTIGQSNSLWNSDNKFEYQVLFSKFSKSIRYPSKAKIFIVQFISKLEFQEIH